MSSSTSATFYLFSLLPPELRLKIWSISTTAVGPRVLVVEEKGRDCSEERFEANGYRNNDTSTTLSHHTSCVSGVPSILCATRESRAVAMEQYKLSFRTVDGRPKWFNTEIDILYVKNASWFWWYLCAFDHINDLPSIHHLAMNARAWRPEVLDVRLLPFRDLKIVYLQSSPLPSAQWHLNTSQLVKTRWDVLRTREEAHVVEGREEVRGPAPDVIWINQFGFVNFPHLRARGQMSGRIGMVHSSAAEREVVDKAWM